jgi:hypothetical protein
MNILSTVLTLAAILCALLAIGFLVISLRGVTSVLFPGLGLVVGTRLIIFLLSILAVMTGFFAWLANQKA